MVSPKRNPVLGSALSPLQYDSLKTGNSPRYRIPGYNVPDNSKEALALATQLKDFELGTPRINISRIGTEETSRSHMPSPSFEQR